jgi:L-asparaginase/Glu-tRNA(Gln) amidotransferase subunit D
MSGDVKRRHAFLSREHERLMQSPSILILTTGGTIDKQYFDSLSQYQITDSVVTKVLSVGLVTHPYRVVEIARNRRQVGGIRVTPGAV